jgi:hypothetical protein
MDCECVDAAAQFRRECVVDQPVTFNPGLPFERLRHNINAEVRLASRSMASVSLVLSALIEHAQVVRCEGLVELLNNRISGSHRAL